MSNSKHDKVSGEKVEKTSPKAKSGDESEEECEVLEESPCGRWQKRREEVQQRDVPGIDCAFLAMDTEEGVEVVWNEVQISEKKSSKVQLAQQATAAENVHEIQEKIKQVFDNLIELEHPNIAKFHKYWMDTTKDRPRVIFITEYMSSGSLRQFLRKTKRSNRTLKAWKRWCTQILSALSYLHCCEPPIIHGNLTTDTIFIQHNGLIKIGSVAPDAIYNHVKTYREEVKNVHYAAPEYAANTAVTTAVDVYSFGICALEMAAMELPANGDAAHSVADDVIVKTLESIEDHLQKDFIAKCLEKEPKKRPTARELLFHPVLFEVHSLKLLSAHKYIKSTKGTADDISSLTNFDVTKVLAEIPAHNGHPSLPFSVPQSNILELEKFLEDVRNGVYPLTAFGSTRRVAPPRVATPEQVESVKNEAKETVELENRRVIRQSCQLNKLADSLSFQMTLLLRMDDQMNRQLTCEFTSEDTPKSLAHELVGFGFINADDIEQITGLIKEHLSQADKHLPVTVCQE